MSPVVPFVRSPRFGPPDELVDALNDAIDGAQVVALSDNGDADRLGAARVAIVDGPEPEQLAQLPDLDWVQSTWAGVESLLELLPDHVVVARMIDPQLATTMAEAVLAWTLYLHRDMPRYARQQQDRVWEMQPLVAAPDRRVGVLGLGELGRASAITLAEHAFDVLGWSRSPKTIDGVECHHGDDGLAVVLAQSEIVVNLLPLTRATTGLLGAEALRQLPPGASVINFGRGPTIDEDALLAALDNGRLDHAVLDVFDVEPLPAAHPFWTHASVTVLPHISGPTTVATAAVIAARNVSRWLETGELPTDSIVDRRHGY